MCPLWAEVWDVAATQKCLQCLEPGGGRVVVRTVSITEVKAVVFPNWFPRVQQHPHLKAKWEGDEDGRGHGNGRDRQEERKCQGHRARRKKGIQQTCPTCPWMVLLENLHSPWGWALRSFHLTGHTVGTWGGFCPPARAQQPLGIRSPQLCAALEGQVRELSSSHWPHRNVTSSARLKTFPAPSVFFISCFTSSS